MVSGATSTPQLQPSEVQIQFALAVLLAQGSHVGFSGFGSYLVAMATVWATTTAGCDLVLLSGLVIAEQSGRRVLPRDPCLRTCLVAVVPPRRWSRRRGLPHS